MAEGVQGRSAVDLAGLDYQDDEAFIRMAFIPLLRRAGDLRTAVAMLAPQPLWLYRIGPHFPADWCRDAYRAAGRPTAIRWTQDQPDVAALAAWLCAD